MNASEILNHAFFFSPSLPFRPNSIDNPKVYAVMEDSDQAAFTDHSRESPVPFNVRIDTCELFVPAFKYSSIANSSLSSLKCLLSSLNTLK